MTLGLLLTIVISLSLSIGVTIGDGIGRSGGKRKTQELCLEKAEIAQIPIRRALALCGTPKGYWANVRYAEQAARARAEKEDRRARRQARRKKS